MKELKRNFFIFCLRMNSYDFVTSVIIMNIFIPAVIILFQATALIELTKEYFTKISLASWIVDTLMLIIIMAFSILSIKKVLARNEKIMKIYPIINLILVLLFCLNSIAWTIFYILVGRSDYQRYYRTFDFLVHHITYTFVSFYLILMDVLLFKSIPIIIGNWQEEKRLEKEIEARNNPEENIECQDLIAKEEILN